MGIFDDLIPDQPEPAASSGGGLFDDLIPAETAAPETSLRPAPRPEPEAPAAVEDQAEEPARRRMPTRAEIEGRNREEPDEAERPARVLDRGKPTRYEIEGRTREEPQPRQDLGDVGSRFARGATEVAAALPEAAAIAGAGNPNAAALFAQEEVGRAREQIALAEERLADNPQMSSESRKRIEDVIEAERRKIAAYEPLIGMAEGPLKPEPYERGLFKRGEKIREASLELFGTPDPQFDDRFISKLSEGGGSMAGFVGLTLLTGVAGGALGGAGVNASGMYRRAREDGATDEQAKAAAYLGALVGSSEVVPIGRALKMLPAKTRGKFADALGRRLSDALQTAGEEGAQEALTEISNNLIEKGLWNPEQNAFEGAGEAALIGAVLGGGLGAITSTPSDPDPERLNSPRLTEDDRKSPLPNATIDDGKAIIDDLLSGKSPAMPEAPAKTEAPEASAAPAEAPQRPEGFSAALGQPEADAPPVRPADPVQPQVQTEAPAAAEPEADVLPVLDENGRETGEFVRWDAATGKMQKVAPDTPPQIDTTPAALPQAMQEEIAPSEVPAPLEDPAQAEAVSSPDDAPTAAPEAGAFQDLIPVQPKAPGKETLRKRPVAHELKTRGLSVQPGSPLAEELKARGINARTHPGLFNSKGASDWDNLPAEEWGDYRHQIGEDGNGYLDRQGLIDALESEMRGEPVRAGVQAQLAEEQAARDAAEAEARFEAAEPDPEELDLSHVPEASVFIPYADQDISTPTERLDYVISSVDTVLRETGIVDAVEPQTRQWIIDTLNERGGNVEDAVWWNLHREADGYAEQTSEPRLAEQPADRQAAGSGEPAPQIPLGAGRPEGQPEAEGQGAPVDQDYRRADGGQAQEPAAPAVSAPADLDTARADLQAASTAFKALDGDKKIADPKGYMDAIKRRSTARKAYADALAEKGGRIELKSETGNGAVITPRMDGKPGARITYFDGKGISGDTHHDTLQAAVRDAVNQGYDIEAPGHMKAEKAKWGKPEVKKATLPKLTSQPVTDQQHDQIEDYLERSIRSASSLSKQEQQRIDKTYAENGTDDVASSIRTGMVPLTEDLTVYRGEALDEVGGGLMSVTLSESTARNFGRVRKIVLKAGTPVYSPRSGISGGEILVDPKDINAGGTPDAKPATERTEAGEQAVIPGAEQSAERSAEARKADQRREMEARQQQSKARTTVPQDDAGPLFDTQGDMFDAPKGEVSEQKAKPSKARPTGYSYKLADRLSDQDRKLLAKLRDEGTNAGEVISDIDGLTRRAEAAMRRKGEDVRDFDARGMDGSGNWNQMASVIGEGQKLAEAILAAARKEKTGELPYPARDEDTGDFIDPGADPETGEYRGDGAAPGAQEMFDAMQWLEDVEGMGLPLDQIQEPVTGTDAGEADLSRMPKAKIFPDPQKTESLIARAKKEGVISAEEARARLDHWKSVAADIGKDGKNGNKVVISLFDYTGAWSQPWADAGYQVIRYDIKQGDDLLMDAWIYERITEYRQAGMEIVGVLSACPCKTFSGAGARWWEGLHDVESPEAVAKVFGPDAVLTGAKSPLEYNVKLYEATRDIIAVANPTRFHVLENPIGRIQRVTGLGNPTARFHPHNFGNPYTKQTQLFGPMNTDLPLANVDPVEGSKMQNKLRGDDPLGKEARSTTPEGFSYAFFMANDPDARKRMLPEDDTKAQPKDDPARAEAIRHINNVLTRDGHEFGGHYHSGQLTVQLDMAEDGDIEFSIERTRSRYKGRVKETRINEEGTYRLSDIKDELTPAALREVEAFREYWGSLDAGGQPKAETLPPKGDNLTTPSENETGWRGNHSLSLFKKTMAGPNSLEDMRNGMFPEVAEYAEWLGSLSDEQLDAIAPVFRPDYNPFHGATYLGNGGIEEAKAAFAKVGVTEDAKAAQDEGPAKADDLDPKRGEAAYRNVSFNPDRRAQSDIEGYVKGVNDLYAELSELAKTADQKAVLEGEISEYRQRYIKHMNAMWDASSRTASSMITGPARFPTARNQKRLSTYDKRVNEFLEWEKKARAAMKRRILDARPAEAKADEAWKKVEAQVLAIANDAKLAAEGGRGFDLSLLKANFYNRMHTLARSGDVEMTDRMLERLEGVHEDVGLSKPVFTARHKIWKLSDVARSAQAATEAAAQADDAIIAEYDGATITNAVSDERVRIAFDERVSRDVADALKKEGWRWSRANTAWQRKNTNAAKESAQRIVGRFFEKTDKGVRMYQRQEGKAKLQALLPDLKARLNKLMIRGVDLSVDPDMAEQGAVEFGPEGIEILIGNTLDGMNTVNHEAIHILRQRGLFSDAEWKALTGEAKIRWLKEFSIEDRYSDLPREAQIEEAIAEAFAAYAEGKAAQGRVKSIFAKIKRFFRAMKEALTGQGIRKAEDIFEAVERGEVGAREGRTSGEELQAVKQQRPSAAVRKLKPEGVQATAVSTHSAAIPDDTRFERFRRLVQDRMLILRRMTEATEKQTGQKIRKEEDPYFAEERYSGRVGYLLDEIEENYTKPILDLISEVSLKITDHKGKEREGYEAVSLWLMARHAKERNAHIASINDQMPDGGSGLTNAEAGAILKQAGANQAVLDQIGTLTDKLGKEMITAREDAGLLSAKEAHIWRTMYKHYVPLQKFAEDDMYDGVVNDARTAMGRKYSVKGKEGQRALGRGTEAFDPLATLLTQAMEVTVRAEKNRVAKVMYNFAVRYPNPAMYEITQPETQRFYNKATGKVETRVVGPAARQLAENEMALKVDGKEYRITFKDPRLAEALGQLGTNEMGKVTSIASLFSRYFSTINTMLSPPFIIVNAFRDMMTAQVNLGATGGDIQGKLRKAALRDWVKAYRGARRSLRGKNDTDYAKWFKEYSEAGGRIHFWKVDNPESQSLDFAKRVKRASRGKLARTVSSLVLPSTRDNPALEFVETINMSVDNAVRLAAYAEARRNGWSKADAASLAKNLTVNFNRRGEIGATMNAWYPFANAAIQGSHVILKAMKSRQVQGIVGGMMLFGLANDLLAAMLSSEDEDGELEYDQLPTYVSERNIIVATPLSETGYVTIPLPYGFNVFFFAGQQMGKLLRRVKSPEEAAGQVLKATVGAFSPISGESGFEMLAPTLLDFANEFDNNRDWLGRPIRPENPYGDYGPQSYKEFNASAPSRTVAQGLNTLTGGSPLEPGILDISPEYIDHFFKFMTGGAGRFAGRVYGLAERAAEGTLGETEAYEVPLARVLFAESGDFLNQNRYFEFREAVQEARAQKKLAEEIGHPMTQEMKDLNALWVSLRQAEKQRKAVREQLEAVYADESLSARERERRLKPLKERRNEVYLRFNRDFIRRMGPQAE